MGFIYLFGAVLVKICKGQSNTYSSIRVFVYLCTTLQCYTTGHIISQAEPVVHNPYALTVA